MSLIYLSLGAGVQSTALLVLSAAGERGVPRADVAIFADTGDEPEYVYRYLEILKAWSPIPIHTVAEGHLGADVLDRHKGLRTRFAAIPAWTRGADGNASGLRRQCTREYKITPIEREVRRILGYAKGERVKKHATALIGISLDEATRMKPSRTAWIENRYPLVDAGLRRADCLRIVEQTGLPRPEKSSCLFCPYHSDAYWINLRSQHPEDFEKAAVFDSGIRDMTRSGDAGSVFLHRSLVPLREVEFKHQRQIPLVLDGEQFDNECEGVCGV